VGESRPAEAISVFDMLKIGVGPSSSHTLGPWRAVQRWLAELAADPGMDAVAAIRLDLFGSLALTGRGHATDIALCLALLGEDPETVPVDEIASRVAELRAVRSLRLPGAGRSIDFDPAADIVFHPDEKLPGHANGMRFTATADDGREIRSTWYSIGGGFVLRDGEVPGSDRPQPCLPYPCQSAAELEATCHREGLSIREMVFANELAWRTDIEVRTDLLRIWRVMLECIHRGCRTGGVLPGGLEVRRRAAGLAASLPGGEELDGRYAEDPQGWMLAVRAANRDDDFRHVLKWTSTFALAVNEENAALGRVVTAPTNGAAGVIPAVLMHEMCFGEPEPSEDRIIDFLLVAGEIGTHFKKNATISAAMGGCQAEIGVSSSMAAAALAELRGATVPQSLMAAEIAMEHHLGMTCDPVAGLVQVPCIERNAMGAIKAINAAELALAGNPAEARVSLDDVIRTMWETARDMGDRYKETSRGGLAVNISVRVPEC
jgi:L-serine dehydratase